MTTRRVILIGLALAVAGGLLLATPLAWIVEMAREELFPATISWDGKTAWKRCESAIAGRTSWPEAPKSACAAMQLCANEATLSEQQLDGLYRAIRDTPGCEPP